MTKELEKKILTYRIIVSLITIFCMIYILFINPLYELNYINILKILGYFSVVSMLMTTIIFLFLSIAQLSGNPKWAPNNNFRGATLVYSGVSALVFVVFFHQDFDIYGLQKVIYYFAHISFPIFLLADNYISIPQNTYKYDLLLYWMIFPFYYLIFIIVESYTLYFDRYRFIAINEQNVRLYPIAIILLGLVFIALSLLIIFINRTKDTIEPEDEI